MIGGHEGAGVVQEVGEGVDWLEPGDHVIFGFIPACGRCPSCASGHSNLCDLGALHRGGTQVADGTSRHHTRDGHDLGLMCLLGTFAEHTVVNEASCIKIDKDWPLDKACLLGCGVVTGWGSAVYTGEVGPGDYVAVVGCGGIGSNAIQGAEDGRRPRGRRDRPGRVQAREGDGVRRDAHLRVDRGGAGGARATPPGAVATTRSS